MPDLILYQRDYCHLCDLALAVLAEARAPDFDSEWVDDSPELEARYGLRVPVLRDNRTDQELDWPFDAAAVRAFLDRHSAPSSRRKPEELFQQTNVWSSSAFDAPE